MIELEYVVAFGMAVTNTFKDKLPVAATPFASWGMIVLAQVLNVLAFGDLGILQVALQEAIIAGGIACGIFAGGTMVRKVTRGQNPLQR